MYKILASLMLGGTLALAACSSSNYNSDEVPDISPDNLYNVAKANMATGDYGLARRYLEAIDARYPFGDITDQVQLDLIYVYYKARDTELASAQIARFLRLNPTHPNIDYVYYLKGLTEEQMRSDLIQDYLGLDRSEKDPSNYFAAFNTYKELINSYPDSIYVADARQRMLFIREELGKRELAIAKYYRERGAYLSSIRHCQTILYTYRNTTSLKAAMDLMARNYDSLKLKDVASRIRAVSEATFGTGKDYKPTETAYQSTKLTNNDLLVAQSGGKSGSKQTKDQGWWDSLFSWWGDDETEQAAATSESAVDPNAAPVVRVSSPAPAQEVDLVPPTVEQESKGNEQMSDAEHDTQQQRDMDAALPQYPVRN